MIHQHLSRRDEAANLLWIITPGVSQDGEGQSFLVQARAVLRLSQTQASRQLLRLFFRMAQNGNDHAAVVDGMEQKTTRSSKQVQASKPTAVPQGTFGVQHLCP